MAKRELVLFGGLGFLFGTLAAGGGWNFYLSFLFAVMLLFIFRSLSKKLERKGLGLEILSLCMFFFGFFYYHFYLNFQNQTQEINFNSKETFQGVVINSPEIKENYQKFNFELKAPYHGEIAVLASVSPVLEYGDKLEIQGVVSENDNEVGLPTTFFPKLRVLDKHQGFWLKEKLLTFKNLLTRNFKKNLGSDQAALLSGITFGERANFSADLKNQMALSGVTHIVALSGYNIAILALAIQQALCRFLSRRKTFYITIAAIFLFVLMVGGEASVVRAAIMGSLILLAQHLGRLHDALHIIILTAALMVFINPTILAWNVGFQLSFLSLLGIVYIEPILRKLLKLKNKKTDSFLSWRENGLTTISAQLAVLPILILNFNQFSLTSVFANVLILFTVPFTMFLGFLLAGLNLLAGFLGFLVAKLASVLLFYQIAVIKIFSVVSLPVGGLFNSKAILIVYYGIILAIVYYFRDKNVKGATEVAPVDVE